MGWAKENRKAEEGKAVNVVIRIALETLLRTLAHLLWIVSSERFGIMTMDSALVKAKGRKSRGSTIPDRIPKLLTASLEDIPDSINLLGTSIEFIDRTIEDKRRTPVMGRVIFIILLRRDVVDGVLCDISSKQDIL